MSQATLPDHFFISSCDGSLCDTRKPHWAEKPLRLNYRRTFQQITTTSELKATLRNGSYTWPGGYPMFFITSDGGALSFKTVRDELRNILDSIRTGCNDGWRVVACDVNWEDSQLYDDHTGELIESAYSDD